MSTMDATQQQQRKKTTKGRQKIEIKKVQKESSRYVTFSKRKNGIFKKAAELSTLCGADVAVILFSEHGKVFSFGNPDVDKVLDRYLAVTDQEADGNSCLLESSSSSSSNGNVTVEGQEFKKSLGRLEEMKREVKMMGNKGNANSGEFWWNLSVADMNKEELEGYKDSLKELKKNILERIDNMAARNAAAESMVINQFIDPNAYAVSFNGFM